MVMSARLRLAFSSIRFAMITRLAALFTQWPDAKKGSDSIGPLLWLRAQRLAGFVTIFVTGYAARLP